MSRSFCRTPSSASSCSTLTSFLARRRKPSPCCVGSLKKSIPFDADETVISYMRQPAREKGVDVVTALARLRIVREYEALAEGADVPSRRYR